MSVRIQEPITSTFFRITKNLAFHAKHHSLSPTVLLTNGFDSSKNPAMFYVCSQKGTMVRRLRPLVSEPTSVNIQIRIPVVVAPAPKRSWESPPNDPSPPDIAEPRPVRHHVQSDQGLGDFSSDRLLFPGEDCVEAEADEQGRADDAEVIQEECSILDLPEDYTDRPESHEQDDGDRQVFEMHCFSFTLI